MKSRWIVNLLLIVAIVILTLVARYEPGLEEPPATGRLLSAPASAVQTIRIQRPLRDTLVLNNTGTGWVIEQQPPLPAESFQIRSLLKLAEQTAARSYPVSELDLSKLALDPPYASVTLNDTTLDFGSLEPLEELRYVRVGDQVHLISDLYQHLIEADYTRFVRRRLLAEQTRIVAIDLPGLSLGRSDSGWTTRPPREVSADTLQQFVNSWQQATALHVRSAEAPVADAEEITLTLGEPEQRIRFLIVSREPELILFRPEYALEYRMGNLAQHLLELSSAATPDSP